MSAPLASVDRAALVALSALPGVGPSRLRALLDGRQPSAVWQAVQRGSVVVDPALAAACATEAVDQLLQRWRAAAAGVDSEAVAAAHHDAGVAVLAPGDAHWPPELDDDPDPPAVLFVRGDPALLAAAGAIRVAVVGTRRATRYGLDVARRLGGELAALDVPVVSGLAAGIDGVAHQGALAAGGAPPIGVVGSGLDVVYPRGHRHLWDRVASAGALCTEAPLGTSPTRWRFPARNRIIAALSAAVVVVESPPSGGSMHTVDEAMRRDRPVLAVPGPVTSLASSGTNRLLADGAAPATGVADILLAVGLGGRRPPSPAAVPAPPGPAGAVLDAMGWSPATLDQLVLRTGLGLAEIATLVIELEADGWLATDGGWYERRR